MGLSSHLPISAHVAPCWCTRNLFFFSLMHPIGPELPISAHLACARVCRQLYVLCASHALVQATVGVGTVIIVYIGVAYTRGGGTATPPPPPLSFPRPPPVAAQGVAVASRAPTRARCTGPRRARPPGCAPGDDTRSREQVLVPPRPLTPSPTAAPCQARGSAPGPHSLAQGTPEFCLTTQPLLKGGRGGGK